MLKYLTKILLTYLLFLAFNTCVHDYSANFLQTEEIVHTVGHQTDDQSGMCTPMCNCLCCNTIVTIPNTYTLQTLNNSSDFQSSFTKDLIPFIQNPTSPPPKA